MKHLSTLILLAMLSLTAMAQEKQFPKTYLRSSVSFVSTILSQDCNVDTYDCDTIIAGGSLGVHYGIRLTGQKTTQAAVYLEAGGEFMLGASNYHGMSDVNHKLMAVTVPVDLILKFPLNYDFTDRILLFAGISPKVNLKAKQKLNFYDITDVESDLFDEKQLGENTAKRMQFGINAGIGFETGRILLSYRFNADMNKFRTFEMLDYRGNSRTMSHTISVSWTLLHRPRSIKMWSSKL